jgi:YD repeat-containing protein
MTSVTENGIGATTSYGYDVLDNLTSVIQGSTTRSFNYSSLKRLTSATNPESGTVNYGYDANGNLLRKADARGFVTTYCTPSNQTLCYDALDQVTPSVTYLYDHDWLTQVSSSVSAYTYSHDAIGRVNGGTQTTNQHRDSESRTIRHLGKGLGKIRAALY